jgi:exosortase E/protease (VPEID-CTERM system)
VSRVAISSSSRPAYRWVAGCFLVAVIELIAAKAIFVLPDVWPLWPVVVAAHLVVKALIFAAALFVLVAWPRRAELFAAMRGEYDGIPDGYAVIANLISFGLLLLFRGQLSVDVEDANPFLPFAYALLVLTTVASLVAVVAPWRYWKDIARSWHWEIRMALVIAVAGFTVGEFFSRNVVHFLSEDLWDRLSGATLNLSYWLLALFQSNAFMDASTRVLGAGNFSVQIFAACSGYEGMALIAAFIAGYLWIFRRSLRFPQVLILFPLAMGIIWLFNAVRIALLVAIGANISPDVALGGFHSQFGWICFLLVAITIITAAQQIPFFSAVGSKSGQRIVEAPSANTDNQVVAFLAPFIAMMAAHIVTRAFAPHDEALYPLKVVAIAAAIYLYRLSYARLAEAPSVLSLSMGGAAGILWIATDPGAGSSPPLAGWIAHLTPLAFVTWLVFRGIGTIVMVPIAEELAFRGYVYRLLVPSCFQNIDLRTVSARALIISSVLFGLMHDRWLAAALAGVLYALLMCRRERLSDAIAAHMATNAVIFGWAVAAGQWSLL